MNSGSTGIIHNPNARRNLKNRRIAENIKSILGPEDGFFQTDHVDGIPDLVDRFFEKNYPVLGINGGDGTIHRVLTVFAEKYGTDSIPKLLFLRGGTMNTVPGALGLYGNPIAIIKKWINSRNNGRIKTVRQQALCVNGKIGFITGAGVVSKFLDAYYKGERRGALKAATLVGKLVPGIIFGSDFARDMFSPLPLAVLNEGKDLGESLYTAVLASTVKEIGLGFRLTYRCYEKPGAFHFAAVKVSPLALIPRIFHLWAGKDPEHKGFLHHGPSCRAKIVHDGVLRWTLDGEMYETEEPLEITMGPQVDIITPLPAVFK